MNKKTNKNTLSTILSILISLVLLFIIYKRVDLSQLIDILKEANLLYLYFYIILMIPQLLIASYRWMIISNHIGKAKISFYRAMKLTIGSYSANLVIPAKMGEFIRVYWMKDLDLDRKPFWLVILEKLLDVLVIIAILAFFTTILIIRSGFHTPLKLIIVWLAAVLVLVLSKVLSKRIPDLIHFFYSKIKKSSDTPGVEEKRVKIFPDEPILFWKIFLISVLLWFVQIFQFYCMFSMFGVKIPMVVLYSGVPLALLSALFPFSVGGIGIRDAVIVWFFGPYATVEVLVSVGILSATRIIFAGLIGLPWFFNQTRKA